jgi:DNA polymerase-1
MYVRQLKDEIIEGDDFIAYYCLTKKENEKITIVSNDRDMAQLIQDNVRVYFLDLKKYVDNVNFSSYFCYHYENAALVKTMTGDSSDTIKGIKGLGETTLVSLFPQLAERKVSLTEILEDAKKQQEQRLIEKKKPLKVLDNIVNAVTDGVQGERVYEINEQLVNLRKPMMTEQGVKNLEELIDGTLDSSGRDLKNVLIYMKRDGIDKTIGEHRYPEYLMPFKSLIAREKLIF